MRVVDGVNLRAAWPDARLKDAEFARAMDGRTVPHWSHLWPRIGRLQRQNMVRVIVLNRYLGEVRSTEVLMNEPACPNPDLVKTCRQ